MKYSRLAPRPLLSIAACVLGLAACAQNGISTPGTGGTTGSQGTAGTTGSAGTTGAAGTGNTTGSAGTTGSSGTTGSAGTGNTTGSAGTNGDGGTTGSAGTSGSAGTTGSAGTNGSAGNTGRGGAAGSSSTGTGGGAAGSSGTIDVMTLAGIPNTYGESLMSSFILMPCYQQSQQDCFTTPGGQCPSTSGVPFEQQGLVQTESFTLGGTAGAMYNMTFNVNGIAEAKYYTGGTRDAGNNAVANAQDAAGTDTFYRGGSPVAQEHYNIYKLIVRKADKSELAHYYLNSFPQVSTAYENHQTFPIHYTKTIPVPGGGSIDLYVSDSNCHAVDNCGPGVYAGTCTASRSIPAEPNLVMPTKYMGKNVSDLNVVNGNKQPYHSQLIHITVTAVVAM